MRNSLLEDPTFTAAIIKNSDFIKGKNGKTSQSTNTTINFKECSKSKIKFAKKTV